MGWSISPRRAATAWVCLAMCWAAWPAAAADDAAPLVDESCYFRHYYQLDWDLISPAALKADGEKMLGKGGMQRLEAQVKARLAHLKIDWAASDWRDRAVVRFACPNAGIQPSPEAEHFMNSPAPSSDWANVEFDDTQWPRQRKPFLVGKPSVGFGVQNCGVRAAYYRTRFFVPDPAAAGQWGLKLTYRGGARVLLNGAEIGRGRLPKGELAPDALAEDYPLEAYVHTQADMEQAAAAVKSGENYFAKVADAVKKELEKGAVWPPEKYLKDLYVAEIFGPFDEAARVGNTDAAYAWGAEGAGSGRPAYARNVWDRVRALRERVLEVKIPADRLRKGENVLAIEARASAFHPVVYMSGGAWFGWHNSSWPHVQVSYLELRGPAGVPSMLKRPPGVQVWAEDPQRQVHDTEWADLGASSGTVRMVGAPNGAYGGQVVIGADKELTGLSVTPTELKSDSGSVIPAAAMQAAPAKPVPLSMLSSTVGSRSKTASDPLVGAFISLERHALTNIWRLPKAQRDKLLDEIHIFDQVGPDGPRTVPADRCQAVWLSLNIPAGPYGGVYRGSVSVSASGVAPVTVPVKVEVYGFRLPEKRDLSTLSALEFSPWAVAKQYGCPLWSDEHYKLMEPGLKLLSRVGNGFMFVPVLSWTEFGNRDDSPIRWRRKSDGSLGWDYSRLDRLLDTVAANMGPPRAIVFVVMNGNPGNPAEVAVEDAAGKKEALKLQGQGVEEPVRRRVWGQFAISLLDHMKARGQDGATYWGYAWDSEGDPMLKHLLAEFTPQVRWAMGGHDIRVDPKFYKVTSWIYKVYGAMSMVNNRQGWKNPNLEFQNPRGGGSVLCLPGPFPAFAYRLTVDRALTVGCRGVARVGVDYWKDTYYDGARGGEVFCQPGMPVHAVFWPGQKGAESSLRFEAMAEAVQEEEARIFLEQAVERKLLPAALAEKAASVVFEHLRETSFIPAGVPAERFIEYGSFGWQERSRRLYRTAAEAAAALGLDVAENVLVLDVAPRSKGQATLRLRNWTAQPRAYKVASDVPWLVAENPDAQAAPGFGTLALKLDGFAVEPGKESKGTVTVTDAASGLAYAVPVTVRAHPVYEVSIQRAVCNVPVGQQEELACALVNHSGAELKWKAVSSAAWITPQPTSGTLPAGKAIQLGFVCKPAEKQAASLESTIIVSEDGGNLSHTIQVKTFVIPEYKAPAMPTGQAVPLEAVDAKLLKSHEILANTEARTSQNWMWHNDLNKPRVADQMYLGFDAGRADLTGLKQAFSKALWVRPHHVSVYKLEGSSFKAFSAWVGLPKAIDRPDFHQDAEMFFEIYVDGQLKAHSARMRVKDEPRLLAVEGLEQAKEIMLVSRLSSMRDSERCLAFWADPKFHK